MISVLLPARGRPQQLRESIDSLLDLAVNPDRVEILVRMDLDDTALDEASRLIDDYMGAYLFRGPRVGYANMHAMYNELARCAAGSNFLIWNDDATMLEPMGWDRALRDGPAFSMQFLRRDIRKTSDLTFFSIGRGVYEAIGRVAEESAVDLYCSHIAMHSGIAVVRDDIVFRHACLPAVDREIFSEDVHAVVRREARRSAMERVVARPEYVSRFAGYNFFEKAISTGIPYPYKIGDIEQQGRVYIP